MFHSYQCLDADPSTGLISFCPFGPSSSHTTSCLWFRLMLLLDFLYLFTDLFSKPIAFSAFFISFQKSNYGSAKQSIIGMKSTEEEN